MNNSTEVTTNIPPAWFELALRSSRETVIFTDTKRNIIYVNPAVFSSHGYKPEEILGHSSYEIFGNIPGNPADLGEFVSREAIGGVWRGEVFNRHKDGSIFPVRLTLSAIYGKDGSTLGFAGISYNISEERQQQKQQEEFLQQLKEADKFKSEFISTLSHEIRTPLTSIRAFSNILVEMGDQADEETRRDFIRQIHAAAERLTGMLNRMLDLSKLESGALSFNDETVNLTGIASEAISDMQGLALETKVSLSLHDPPLELRVLGDPDRLREVFNNLLSNAIKYSPAGNKVVINLWKEDKDPPLAIVEVADRGSGIPEGEEKNIFNRFQQSSLAGDREGVGLGLSICQRIVKHYGGTITACNREGGGTCFRITLPAILASYPG